MSTSEPDATEGNVSKSREDYVEHFLQEDEVLVAIREDIVQRGMPPISVPPELGRLLTFLAKSLRAQNILEIGALGGYSGVCLARGLKEGGRLYSLELKEEFAAVAKQNLNRAGLAHVVEYRIGEALDSLVELDQQGIRFDLFFIDADKGNYSAYLEWAIRLATPGALIAADNVLLGNRVLNPDNDDPSTIAIREFTEKMASDPRLESLILPVRDGFALARVKE